MSRSIFFKYFSICSAVILISFLSLGTVLLLISSQYFVTEKKTSLEENVINAQIETNITLANTDIVEWKLFLGDVYARYSQAIGADFFLVGEEGNIVTSSDKYTTRRHDNEIDFQYLEDITNEPIYTLTDFGGVYDRPYHSVGMKFSSARGEFYLFAASPKSDQDDMLSQVMVMFGVSSIIVIFFAFIAVYVGTKRLTKPIRDISEVAKRFGRGDFSEKIGDYDTIEINELGASLNDMSTSLSHLENMRKSFVANVSHELRTPMTSIGGFVDGMLDGTIPQKDQKQYLRVISNEVNRLTRLVKSMLNMAKIESGEMDLEKTMFNCVDPIVDTLVTFETRLEEKSINITGLDGPRIMLYADKDLIHQVIYNLIENAVKFVDEGGNIEFKIYYEGDQSVICIKNTGAGISQEDLPLVFDRFYKTDKSRGKDTKGVGLGLHITKTIVNMHGGNVMVRSVQGEYTEFVVTIPSNKK